MTDMPWLASYPAGVPARIDADAFASVDALLLDACGRFAERPAFDCFGAEISYADWDRLSLAFAGFLRDEFGCRPGGRLALMLPNVLAYPVAFLGALRAGLTVVNVNPLYTARELAQQLDDCGATAIVIMENFAHRLEEVIGRTTIEHVVVAHIGDFMSSLKGGFYNLANRYVRHAVPPWHLPRAVALEAACRHVSPHTDLQPVKPRPPALLQYTGGTTGVPKGAVLTHRNLVANVLQVQPSVLTRLEPGVERVVAPLPLYHIFALVANLLTIAAIGGLTVLVPDPRDLRGLIGTIRRVGMTGITGVNTLFGALVNRPEFRALDFGPLKIAIGGGAAVVPAVAERWHAVTGVPLIEGYGLTEASPVVTLNRLDRPVLGAVGLPLPSTEVSIRDDDGHALATDEAGEIWVRGPQVMPGYWNSPDETRKVLTYDGWLKTGDVGALDPHGVLRLLDRKKDMINVSGFKVYPNEIEAVVAALPGVVEAGVVGVPDARTGQAVKLYVVRADPGPTEEAIRAHCRANLTAYKLPTAIEFRASLPKSPIGKVLRKDLR